MKYLVNRKTKEHVIKHKGFASFDVKRWYEVQADSEGWIAHTGNECPLPDDCMVDTMWDDGQGAPRMAAGHWKWRDPSITHYRPILAEKAQEPEPVLPADCIETPDLFNRLDAAHQAAAQIPDIIAQIKAKLEQYGHTVVPLNPFVSAAIAEPEPAIETPQEDMSDWRNWREGDLVECVDGHGWEVFKQGGLYRITKTHKEWVYIETWPIYQYIGSFRFHSRPAKGEK